MASNLLKHVTFFMLVTFAYLGLIQGGDPDILSDFVVPSNLTNVDGNFFTFTGLRGVFEHRTSPTAPYNGTTKASLTEFQALIGQSVSLAVLLLPGGGVSAPHIRPHATGLFFLLKGSLEVGFVDTTNKLYTQTLHEGDLFIFPKGLVHYQYNADPKRPAMGIAAFGSASAAVVSLPTTLFASGVDDGTLAKSFRTNVATIKKIKAGLVPKS